MRDRDIKTDLGRIAASGILTALTVFGSMALYQAEKPTLSEFIQKSQDAAVITAGTIGVGMILAQKNLLLHVIQQDAPAPPIEPHISPY